MYISDINVVVLVDRQRVVVYVCLCVFCTVGW